MMQFKITGAGVFELLVDAPDAVAARMVWDDLRHSINVANAKGCWNLDGYNFKAWPVEEAHLQTCDDNTMPEEQ